MALSGAAVTCAAASAGYGCTGSTVDAEAGRGTCPEAWGRREASALRRERTDVSASGLWPAARRALYHACATEVCGLPSLGVMCCGAVIRLRPREWPGSRVLAGSAGATATMGCGRLWDDPFKSISLEATAALPTPLCFASSAILPAAVLLLLAMPSGLPISVGPTPTSAEDARAATAPCRRASVSCERFTGSLERNGPSGASSLSAFSVVF